MSTPTERPLEDRVAELELTLDILMDAMEIVVKAVNTQDDSINLISQTLSSIVSRLRGCVLR